MSQEPQPAGAAQPAAEPPVSGAAPPPPPPAGAQPPSPPPQSPPPQSPPPQAPPPGTPPYGQSWGPGWGPNPPYRRNRRLFELLLVGIAGLIIGVLLTCGVAVTVAHIVNHNDRFGGPGCGYVYKGPQGPGMMPRNLPGRGFQKQAPVVPATPAPNAS